MATKKRSQALVSAQPEDPAIALADALMRLDDAIDAVQARMGELAEAHRAKQAAKKVPTERVKPATKSVKPGTGTLTLSAGAQPRPPRTRPVTRPMAPATGPVLEAVVPEASIEDAADRLLKTLESQADRLDGRGE